MIPTPWAAVVLALGAYRLTRLIGWDDLPPIARLRARVTGERQHMNSTVNRELITTYRRPTLEHFLSCPFCQGFWVSLAAYLVWRFEPTGTLYFLAPFALSAAVGLISKNLDP